MTQNKTLIWSILATAAAILIGLITWLSLHHWRPRTVTIQGAVIRRDIDDRRELPIPDVTVTASDGATSANTQSDASGFYKLTFPEGVWTSDQVNLEFRHPDYKPLDLIVETTLRSSLQSGLRSGAGQLVVAAMESLPQQAETKPAHRPSVVSNIKIRYTTNAQTEDNIGSAVKTFQAFNQGNQRCEPKTSCSPDGRWKAATGSVTLDAGPGNEFRNVRASCIAGPCPFTRIDSSGFEHGGRVIYASALDWSDTATFLLEAEVFRVSISSNVRESYPVIFGRALNFTLPPTQEGVSIEAEIDGTAMVFPLGPDLYLSWATCLSRINSADQQNTSVYRCELKPGYRF